MSRQSWKTKKSTISLLKRTFFRVFNFDGLYFWNHWEFRDVMYLIWKVSSVVKWSSKTKVMVALLLYATANRKRPFYTLKWQKVRLFCTGLYVIYNTISTITSVCPSVRPSFVRSSENFVLLKLPWNHPLTPGVDPRGWPRVAPGHAAPPEELARARRALSSND